MSVKVTFTGDEQNLVKSQDNIAKGADEVKKAYKGIADETRRLEREAVKTWREVATPLERYNKKMEDLEKNLKDGRISQEHFNRAVAKAKTELDEAGNASQKFAGPSAIARLASYASGFVSITTAVNVAREAIRYLVEERDKAMADSGGAAGGLAKLAQVGTSSQDLERLHTDARTIFGSAATGTLGEAANIRFALRSAGLDSDMGFVIQLAQSKIVEDAENVVNSAAALRKTMSVKETGSLSAITSKAFAASEFATTTAEDILMGAAEAGGAASTLGISDEELLAAVAVVSSATGSGSKAGTQIRNLLQGIKDKGALQSNSIAGLVREATSTMASTEDADIKDLLGGSLEGLAAFQTLSRNMDEFQLASGRVKGAEAEGTVFERIRMATESPTVASAIILQQSENMKVLQDEQLGNRAALQKAMDNTTEFLGQAMGTPGIVRGAVAWGTKTRRGLGFEDDMSDETIGRLNQLESRFRSEGQTDIADILERQQSYMKLFRQIEKNTRTPLQPSAVPLPEAN